MRTVFALENGSGTVAVLLGLRGQGINAFDADAIRMSLKDTMDIHSWNISIYYRSGLSRDPIFQSHAAYDQCYFNAIRDKGISLEVRSRIIRRQDQDVLAQDQPVSYRTGGFYTHRKAWRYSYVTSRERDGALAVNFRRSGFHWSYFRMDESSGLT